MKLAYFSRLLELMDQNQVEVLMAAISEGRDELASRVRQCKEYDADFERNPLVIAATYSKEDSEVRLLNDVVVRLTADLSVASHFVSAAR